MALNAGVFPTALVGSVARTDFNSARDIINNSFPIQTIDIGNLQVTTGKLALLAVLAAQLAADAVETIKIKNLNVTTAKAALGFGRYVPVPSSAWQYAIGGLTADGAWHNDSLDFTGVVPAGAIGIVLRVSISDDAVGSVVGIRHDAGSSVSLRTMRTQVANVINEQNFFLPLEADRLMDYNISNLVWTSVDIAVIGYFI